MSGDSQPNLSTRLLAQVVGGDFLVLERERDGRFVRIPDFDTPTWAVHWPDAHWERPAAVFPFLETFLPEAEAFWTGRQTGPCGSGPWSQGDLREGNTPLELDARAILLDGRAWLLIRRLGPEYHEHRQALQQARELALAHERLASETEKKEVLLHCIVHDLNGPLAAMLGCLEILRRERLSKTGREVIAIGLAEADRQSHRIQELLDCFAAEVAQLDPASASNPQVVDLRECALRVWRGFSPAFLAKSITPQLDEPPDASAHSWRVSADASRLERVLYNLVENALRHCPSQGTVTLGLVRQDGTVEASIADSGRGIDPEAVPHLFQKFGKGRQGGRAGLGLYFCRITVERWGGTIGGHNLHKGGSRFWFRLKVLA